ncbi:nucleotide exchange factor GrpE [Gemmatimonadota bacterium]
MKEKEPVAPLESEQPDVDINETVPGEMQIAEMQDRLLRVSAEFENYKKRRQRETNDLLRFAHEALIRDLLPVIDSFERAILSSEGTRDYDAFHDGILLILQQLHEILTSAGVERLSPEGEIFDPNWHEAVGVCPHDKIAPDHVAVVVEPGYRLYDRIIRPARVMVVSHPSADGESA